MALRIRVGDTVVVRSGSDKGRTGKVLSVDPGRNRVVVEGINMQFRHVSRSKQNPKGGRVRREGPIHRSKVQIWSETEKKGQRFSTTVKDGTKVRIGRKDGQVVG